MMMSNLLSLALVVAVVDSFAGELPLSTLQRHTVNDGQSSDCKDAEVSVITCFEGYGHNRTSHDETCQCLDPFLETLDLCASDSKGGQELLSYASLICSECGAAMSDVQEHGCVPQTSVPTFFPIDKAHACDEPCRTLLCEVSEACPVGGLPSTVFGSDRLQRDYDVMQLDLQESTKECPCSAEEEAPNGTAAAAQEDVAAATELLEEEGTSGRQAELSTKMLQPAANLTTECKDAKVDIQICFEGYQKSRLSHEQTCLCVSPFLETIQAACTDDEGENAISYGTLICSDCGGAMTDVQEKGCLNFDDDSKASFPIDKSGGCDEPCRTLLCEVMEACPLGEMPAGVYVTDKVQHNYDVMQIDLQEATQNCPCIAEDPPSNTTAAKPDGLPEEEGSEPEEEDSEPEDQPESAALGSPGSAPVSQPEESAKASKADCASAKTSLLSCYEGFETNRTDHETTCACMEPYVEDLGKCDAKSDLVSYAKLICSDCGGAMADFAREQGCVQELNKHFLPVDTSRGCDEPCRTLLCEVQEACPAEGLPSITFTTEKFKAAYQELLSDVSVATQTCPCAVESQAADSTSGEKKLALLASEEVSSASRDTDPNSVLFVPFTEGSLFPLLRNMADAHLLLYSDAETSSRGACDNQALQILEFFRAYQEHRSEYAETCAGMTAHVAPFKACAVGQPNEEKMLLLAAYAGLMCSACGLELTDMAASAKECFDHSVQDYIPLDLKKGCDAQCHAEFCKVQQACPASGVPGLDTTSEKFHEEYAETQRVISDALQACPCSSAALLEDAASAEEPPAVASEEPLGAAAEVTPPQELWDCGDCEYFEGKWTKFGVTNRINQTGCKGTADIRGLFGIPLVKCTLGFCGHHVDVSCGSSAPTECELIRAKGRKPSLECRNGDRYEYEH